MKKILLILAILAPVSCASAPDAASQAVTAPVEASIPSAAPEVAAAADENPNDNDSSYGFGMYMAATLQSYGVMTLDYEHFFQGFKDYLSGAQTRLTQEEAVTAMNALITDLQASANAASQAAEEAYFVQNATGEGVVSTASGLQYKVLVQGTGAIPTPTDKVMVRYEGSFADGTPFDTTKDAATGVDTAVQFDLATLIPGFVEGILLMNVGSTYTLYVPSALGYGSAGVSGIIPAYSPLIFTVTLDSIVGQ
jgi:FKBP-type peptidyl-prolyl cis-trans isomerase